MTLERNPDDEDDDDEYGNQNYNDYESEDDDYGQEDDEVNDIIVNEEHTPGNGSEDHFMSHHG